MTAKDFLKTAESIEDEIRENRRWLHAHAETEFNLKETTAFVKEKLQEIGLEYTDCGKCGISAIIGKNEGKTFLLRADMDALPINEESGLDFSCGNGNMHACGHDMHTAMLLGAAKILKQFENELSGKVKLMFQPAEEILSGANNMIENGILKNPDVDAAMMLHVMAGFPLKTGTVIVPLPGVGAPAADYFTINIQGKGCHGSTPHLGIDSITAAAHILIALQEITAREMGVTDEAIITVGSFHGGTAGNVIAHTTDLQGTLRSFNDDLRQNIKKRITEIAENIGNAFRTKVTVTFGSGCPTLHNDENLVNSTEENLRSLLGDELVVNAKSFSAENTHKGGSEDFSYISKEVPSVMLALASGEPVKGYKYHQHHPKVVFDESVLKIGSAVLAFNAYKWLENNIN
ncbi:MAG: amidohydrolase [Ruminococcaceae bacterium]|nr:amidohydrolase [Oscillospiraceae bacterium]